MKIKITFKDPDGVLDAIEREVRQVVENGTDGLSRREKEDLIEERCEELKDKLGRWIEYNEYLRVEFDTEAKTATVLPSK